VRATQAPPDCTGRRGRVADRSGPVRPRRARPRPGGASARDPQDQARRDPDDGEPLVRRVLRHVSGCRRAAATRRALQRVLAGPDHAHLRVPLPRHERPQHGRAARAPRRGPRHQRRQDGRLHAPGPARPRPGLHGRSGHPALLAGRRPPRRDGVPRLARDPELLGVRAPLRPPGPHVPAGHLVEPPGPPVHGLGVVGALPEAWEADELCERDREPARTASRAAEPDEPQAELRVDRPDVPAAPLPREVALLRLRRQRARL
jgi:hypothetical protein